MEDNKQQLEEQSKEAKKIEVKYHGALRTLPAIFGSDWAKAPKIGKMDLPEVIANIVRKKKEEVIKKFEESYILLVEKKKRLDKTEIEKRREFEKIILEEKKAFLKEVDIVKSYLKELDQIERDYYDTLNTEAPEGSQEPIEEPPNQ